MNFSVALVSYNAEKYLSEQIDTILLNLGEEDELIISDDGSTDNTIKIIDNYLKKDKRIKLYQIPHGGCNANYENAISHCNNEIIVLSDDDNVWEDNKLETIKKAYLDNPKATLIMHDCTVVDEHLNLIEESFIKFNNAKPGLWKNFLRSRFGGSLISFRKELCKYILPFPKKMPFFYDDFIGLMAGKHGKVIFINDKLSKWRRYKGASSTQFVSLDGQIVKKKKSSIKGLTRRTWERIRTRIVKFWYLLFR